MALADKGSHNSDGENSNNLKDAANSNKPKHPNLNKDQDNLTNHSNTENETSEILGILT